MKHSPITGSPTPTAPPISVSQFLIHKAIYRDDLPQTPSEVVFRILLFNGIARLRACPRRFLRGVDVRGAAGTLAGRAGDRTARSAGLGGARSCPSGRAALR